MSFEEFCVLFGLSAAERELAWAMIEIMRGEK